MVNSSPDDLSVNAIEVDGLTVKRGGRVVIDRLDLTVRAGTVTGLLGPSGCGKTTLMRAIVGVQIVEAGEVRVLGLPAGSASLRHSIGYVTQAPSVYADLTVRDNLRYFAAVLGLGDITEAVDRVINQVSLADHADALTAQLSGGQRARVSLATALLGSPELLVLDEPTVGLDPVLRRELWALFHRLTEAGRTLLVSSHVMDEAERCDRLLLMRDGAVLADDTPIAMRQKTGAATVEDAFLTLVERAEVRA